MKLIVIPRNESHTPTDLPPLKELLDRALAPGVDALVVVAAAQSAFVSPP